MATLFLRYELCSLHNQEDLLGVESDSNPDSVIVTFGKDVVMKYDLKDGGHLKSWDCSQPLSTPVVYDQKFQKYAAVFNSKNIYLWEDEVATLDNAKRHKLHLKLFALLTYEGIPTIVVQKTGATTSLPWAIENKNSWTNAGFIRNSEEIVKCQLKKLGGQLYLCLLVKEQEKLIYCIVPLKGDNYVESYKELRKVQLRNSSEKLVAHEVLLDTNDIILLTLWSDNNLYKYSLLRKTSAMIPGSLVGKLSEISAKNAVATVTLSENAIAAYGANNDGTGAVLLIYHLNWKLIQVMEKFGKFDPTARLWKQESKVLLGENKSLSAFPYKLDSQKIGSRLGCLKLQSKAIKKSKKVPKQISQLQDQGVSNMVIQTELIPQFIDTNDTTSILWCLENFQDIPEDLLVSLLHYSLNLPSEILQNGSGSEIQNPKDDILQKILSSRFSQTPMIKEMREKLEIDKVLTLLEILVNEFESKTEPRIDHDNLHKWIITMIDAYYQHCLLSQNPEIPKLFERIAKVNEIQLQALHELDSLRPMVIRLINGLSLPEGPGDLNEFYSIEEIKLY